MNLIFFYIIESEAFLLSLPVSTDGNIMKNSVNDALIVENQKKRKEQKEIRLNKKAVEEETNAQFLTKGQFSMMTEMKKMEVEGRRQKW